MERQESYDVFKPGLRQRRNRESEFDGRAEEKLCRIEDLENGICWNGIA